MSFWPLLQSRRSRAHRNMPPAEAAREGMPYPTTRHFARGSDGTEIAWYAPEFGATSKIPAGPVKALSSLVLTNGLSTTARFWKTVATGLAESHRVVDWSYRGHGESASAANSDYTLATHADDLLRVTLAVVAKEPSGTPPPVHIAFSMGVTVLLELYRQRPDLVRAMVLIAGGADSPYASAAAIQTATARAAVRAVLRAVTPVMPLAQPIYKRVLAMNALVKIAKASGVIGRTAPDAEIAHFFQSVGAMDSRAYFGTLASLVNAHASDVLGQVRVPVLIVAPERDVMALREDLRALRSGIPHAEWVLLPKTGHAILLEAGEEIARRIRKFTAQLPSWT
jgi:pimeloyl-ACP methyl ester carboxylesterase